MIGTTITILAIAYFINNCMKQEPAVIRNILGKRAWQYSKFMPFFSVKRFRFYS